MGELYETDANGYAYVDLEEMDGEIRVVKAGYVPQHIFHDNYLVEKTLSITMVPAVVVTNEAQLLDALSNPSITDILITQEITLSSSLTIDRDVALYGMIGYEKSYLMIDDNTSSGEYGQAGVYIIGDINVLLNYIGVHYVDSYDTRPIVYIQGATVELIQNMFINGVIITDNSTIKYAYKNSFNYLGLGNMTYGVGGSAIVNVNEASTNSIKTALQHDSIYNYISNIEYITE